MRRADGNKREESERDNTRTHTVYGMEQSDTEMKIQADGFMEIKHATAFFTAPSGARGGRFITTEKVQSYHCAFAERDQLQLIQRGL